MSDILKIDLCDTSAVKNKTNPLLISFKNQYISFYVHCPDAQKYDTTMGSWKPHLYHWNGRYKRTAITGIEIVDTVENTFNLSILLAGVDYMYCPTVTFENLEEAQKLEKRINEWLNWD